jgi:hypothetical protein
MHVPPAWREGYAGFYNTYSVIRLQDVRASFAGEMHSTLDALESLQDADAGADPRSYDFEYYETVLLDAARDLLLSASAVETTILQRRLLREQ